MENSQLKYLILILGVVGTLALIGVSVRLAMMGNKSFFSKVILAMAILYPIITIFAFFKVLNSKH
jgi:hypothetical protein